MEGGAKNRELGNHAKAGDTLVSARSLTMEELQSRERIVVKVDSLPTDAFEQTVISNRRIHRVLETVSWEKSPVNKTQACPGQTLPSGMAPRPEDLKNRPKQSPLSEHLPLHEETCDRVWMIFDLFSKDKSFFESCKDKMDWLSKVFFIITPVRFTIRNSEVVIDRAHLLEIIHQYNKRSYILLVNQVNAIFDSLANTPG